MNLNLVLVAISFYCVSVESAHCGKFKELDGEAKLSYAKKKYVTYADTAFDEYNSKARAQKLRESSSLMTVEEADKIISDVKEEENKIFSKALKWGAKYLLAVSVPKQSIPDEFVRFTAQKFQGLRNKAVFELEDESEADTIRKMQKDLVEKRDDYEFLKLVCASSGYNELAEQLDGIQMDSNEELFDKAFKQRSYIFIEALEDLIEDIEEKSKSTENAIKNNFSVAYVYNTLEEISPGCLSDHLPKK